VVAPATAAFGSLSFAALLRARTAAPPGGDAGGCCAPLVAAATVYVCHGAARSHRVLPIAPSPPFCRRLLTSETVGARCPGASRALRVPPLPARAAWDAPFLPLVDALVAHADGASSAEAAAPPGSPPRSPPRSGTSPPRRASPRRPRSPRVDAPRGEPFFWMDALCLPQPGCEGDSDASADAAATAHAQLRAWSAAMAEAGHLAVVLSPWQREEEAPRGRKHPGGGRDAGSHAPELPAARGPPPRALRPLPLSRGWCLYELAAALRAGAKLSVLLPAGGAEWLHRATLNGWYPALRAGVTACEIRAAAVSAPAARAAIRGAAAGAHGAGAASAGDAAVARALGGWLLDAAVAPLLANSGTRGCEGALRAVADHCLALGRLAPAEALMRASLARARAAGGSADPQALDCMADLAAILQSQERLGEAETLLRCAVEAGRRARGANHLCTLAAEAQLLHVQRAAGVMCLRRFTRLVCSGGQDSGA
jgi:hypothetical protein